MSDEDLRNLERKWASSQSQLDLERYQAALIRLGTPEAIIKIVETETQKYLALLIGYSGKYEENAPRPSFPSYSNTSSEPYVEYIEICKTYKQKPIVCKIGGECNEYCVSCGAGICSHLYCDCLWELCGDGLRGMDQRYECKEYYCFDCFSSHDCIVSEEEEKEEELNNFTPQIT